jgi:hypothetical protein
MPKFRKKPVVIEAVQLTDGTFDAPTTQLYLHRDAARAWQAFRDWLNGVGDRVLIEGATFKGPRPGAWLTIDPKTGVQTFDLRGATITYGGKDD